MFYVIFVICWQFGLASVLNGPVNTAAVVNSSLKITCIIDARQEVLWYYYPPNRDKTKINDDGKIILPLFNNFRVGEKAHMLETDSVQLKNAGAISCSSVGKELFAELIVLTSQPICSFKPIANETELSCNVGYAGNWRPSIEWTNSKGSTTSGTLRLSEKTISSTLKIPSISNNDYSQYACRVFFPNNSFQASWASNEPESLSCLLGPKDDSHNSQKSNDSKHWIIIGFVMAACVVVLVIIVVVVRKQQKACKASPGPDLVQLGEIVQHQNGHVFMNHNDHCAAAAAARPLPAFPDEEVQARDIVYAEVTVDDRRHPHYMHDSPAWNNSHIDGVKSLQSSPAWSHNNGKVFLSKTNPRKEKPMDIDGIEYLDVSSVARIPVPPSQLPRRPPARLPSKSYLPNTYAAIDHTSRPPPPPPPEDE